LFRLCVLVASCFLVKVSGLSFLSSSHSVTGMYWSAFWRSSGGAFRLKVGDYFDWFTELGDFALK
jgi:hypothetical protein